MTYQEKAFDIYKNSRLSEKVQDALNEGCSPDDNNFIQGVFDEVYSLISTVFNEDEMEEVEVGELLDLYHFS